MPHALRFVAGIIAAALPLVLAGCGSSTTGGDDPGLALVKQYDCQSCHSPTTDPTDLSGSPKNLKPQYGKTSYGPNLTPDKATGNGNWTDAHLFDAIYTGRDQDGTLLCSVMPVFGKPCQSPAQDCRGPMSEADAHAIVTYLRSLDAVSNKIPPTPNDCQ